MSTFLLIMDAKDIHAEIDGVRPPDDDVDEDQEQGGGQLC